MAEVALGSRSKQVSITITMCSKICLLNMVLIHFTVICEQGALICWSGWIYHLFLVILNQDITNGHLLWRPLADVGGKEFMVVTILRNTADTRWELWGCLMSYKWASSKQWKLGQSSAKTATMERHLIVQRPSWTLGESRALAGKQQS